MVVPQILHLDASPRSERAISRHLTKLFIERWLHDDAESTVIYRDLGHYPVPLIDELWIAATFNSPEQRTSEQIAALQVSDALIDELLMCDRYVFGIPMYNFSVPANFKAYLDQIIRVGRTFTPDWQGLLTEKKLLVITTRGGSYRPRSELESFDFQEPFLRTVFEFIGITDITFIHAENLTEGAEARQQALDNARTAIQKLIEVW